MSKIDIYIIFCKNFYTQKLVFEHLVGNFYKLVKIIVTIIFYQIFKKSI